MYLRAHGSGKTYTIVKRIEKELQTIKDYQGIIACSFTKEASEELKSRINSKLNVDNCIIGTIDSLVKSLICMFVNRGLKGFDEKYNQVIITRDIIFPNDNVVINNEQIFDEYGKLLKINDLVRYYDRSSRYKSIGKMYYKEWLNRLKQNQYEISFPSYFFASYLVRMDIFKNWFCNRFTSIYIDEAQDLNFFQHYFFDTLKEETNLDIIMVGDANQSIYQFRGARPELFKSLVNKGYTEYKINVSIRCHPSISYYANKIYDFQLEKSFNSDSRVHQLDKISLEFLKKLDGITFILTENNSTAQELYEIYKNDFDIIYSKKMDIDSKNYKDYYLNSDVIDELLRYYLNYDNILDKYKYPYEKIEPLLKNSNPKIKPKDFKIKSNISLAEFLNNTCELLGISLCRETINEISSKIEDKKYKYYYYVVEKRNRIMTIHSSKGLECDNAVVVLDNSFNKINEEFKNKLFVAITRARNNVFILSKNNVNVKHFIDELLH